MAKLVIFKDNTLVKIFPLEKELIFIGRKGDNDLVLPHTSVSRQHAKVCVKDGVYQVMDLDSLNGITLNGNKVTKTQLADGDPVGLGDFSIIFHQEDSSDAGLLAPQSLRSSTILKDELNATQAFAPRGDYATIQDSYEALRALFVLVNRFQTLVDANQLLSDMIGCLLDIFSAERGFILLYTSKTGKFDLAVSRGIDGQEAASTVSHTIALQVAKERKPIHITDAEADHQYQHLESVKRQQIRSILCAPIIKKQRTIGVVYLDSQLSKKVFTTRDLSFLDAFTQHAAVAIERAQDRDRLQKEASALKTLGRTESQEKHDFEAIVGTGPRITEVLDGVKEVAGEDVTVILMGESGTGKELLAKAIHYSSPRRDKPFVAVNCMALSEDVIESELFGHEPGAFTGAVDRRQGRFELADGGTIFLDEIGELSPRVQAKLLRVIQERQVERVRQDLYYRIMVFPIRVPPLRERREDIGPLVEHYIARFNTRMARKRHSGITPAAIERLIAYDWPGNVRELINIIERAFVIEKGDLIDCGSLPADLSGPAHPALVAGLDGSPRTYELAMREFERVFLSQALAKHQGDVAKTALALGMTRKALSLKLQDHALVPAARER
ncbi:MAG: sigma 54-interacting transcriptional regulator [Candidatus Riflebacteria bacterium]|nr:sigma 54-interacting transcriptional regulator [Candidatus Riflebacteria bacterium]